MTSTQEPIETPLTGRWSLQWFITHEDGVTRPFEFGVNPLSDTASTKRGVLSPDVVEISDISGNTLHIQSIDSAFSTPYEIFGHRVDSFTFNLRWANTAIAGASTGVAIVQLERGYRNEERVLIGQWLGIDSDASNLSLLPSGSFARGRLELRSSLPE